MKFDRFRRRRAKLARRRLCIRCGTERPASGHKCCTACIEIEAEKRRQRVQNQKAARVEARRIERKRRRRAAIAALLARLDGELSAAA